LYFSPGGNASCTAKTPCPDGYKRFASQTEDQTVEDNRCESFNLADCQAQSKGYVPSNMTSDSFCETCSDWYNGTVCRVFSETTASCEAKGKFLFQVGGVITDTVCVDACPFWYDQQTCREFTYTAAECNALGNPFVSGTAVADSYCGAACAVGVEFATGTVCQTYNPVIDVERCAMIGRFYHDGTLNADRECYSIDDFKTKNFGEAVNNMVECADGEFAHMSPSGDGFNCVTCNLKTFIDEYSTKRTIGRYKHGKCCRNTHHTVCHSLLEEYTSKCENGATC